MCFKMSFKYGKGLCIVSGIVKGIPDSADTQTRKARELKAIFIRETVRTVPEVEWRSLDGACSKRRSDR